MEVNKHVGGHVSSLGGGGSVNGLSGLGQRDRGEWTVLKPPPLLQGMMVTGCSRLGSVRGKGFQAYPFDLNVEVFPQGASK